MAPRLTPIEDTQASSELQGLFRIAEERGASNSVLTAGGHEEASPRSVDSRLNPACCSR